MDSKYYLVVGLLLIINYQSPITGAPTDENGEGKKAERATLDDSGEKDEYIGPILKCKRGSDELINKCLRRILEDLRPRLAKGIPEIGLEPLDPFYLDQIKFKQGHGSIVIEALLTNTTVLHLAEFSRAEFKVQSKNRILTFDLEAPRVRVDGKYNLGGKILLFPIGGTGPYWFDIGNVKVRGYAKLVPGKSENGTKILQIADIKLDLQIKDLKVKLLNLFSGNPVLGPVINNVLNENVQDLFLEVKPNIVKIIEGIVQSIANRIIGNMPFLHDYLYFDGTTTTTTDSNI